MYAVLCLVLNKCIVDYSLVGTGSGFQSLLMYIFYGISFTFICSENVNISLELRLNLVIQNVGQGGSQRWDSCW